MRICKRKLCFNEVFNKKWLSLKWYELMSNNNRACGARSDTRILYFRCKTECLVDSLIPHVINT